MCSWASFQMSLGGEVFFRSSQIFQKLTCEHRSCMTLLTCILYIYIIQMIRSIKHKGLSDFFLTGSTKGICPHHAAKLRILLTALNVAKDVKDLNVPAWNLHALKGDLKKHWSLTVNGNWRITFMLMDEDVYLVNYLDYH